MTTEITTRTTTEVTTTGSARWASLRRALVRPFAVQDPTVALLSRTFLVLLLVADFVFMILHLIYWYTDAVSSDFFSISRERGYAEFFQYIKLLWLVVLFAGHAIRHKERSYLFWSAVFGYILLDDSMTIHERAGELIRRNLGMSSFLGLRGADYGELIFYAVVLGGLLLCLIPAYYYGTRAFRHDSHYILGLLVVFGFFAGVGDILHMLVRETFVFRMFDVIEDGGEMVMISMIVWFALALIARSQPAAIRSSRPTE